jgi:cell wall-associated NlpC family hydrolase
MTNAEIMLKYCEDQLGAPYVFGARGQNCTPLYRKQRYNACGSEHPTIKTKCQVLMGKSPVCTGCVFQGKKCFDCRGLTYCAAQAAGLRLQGAGATSQWNDAKNWKEKGLIVNMPVDKICLVFFANGSVMEHTALYTGIPGKYIEASVNVRCRPANNPKPTHYGRLFNMDVEIGINEVVEKPENPTTITEETIKTEIPATIQNGSSGNNVVTLQKLLNGTGINPQLNVDGKFGKLTGIAVRNYQKSHSLKIDGIVGSNSWKSLLGIIS